MTTKTAQQPTSTNGSHSRVGASAPYSVNGSRPAIENLETFNVSLNSELKPVDAIKAAEVSRKLMSELQKETVGSWDHCFTLALSTITARSSIFIGPPSTGKTSRAVILCERAGLPFKRVVFNGGMKPYDLVGYVDSKDKTWVRPPDGIDPRYTVHILDEFTQGHDKTLDVLKPALYEKIIKDEDGLFCEELPEGSFMIATGNRVVEGAGRLMPAMADRFSYGHMSGDISLDTIFTVLKGDEFPPSVTNEELARYIPGVQAYFRATKDCRTEAEETLAGLTIAFFRDGRFFDEVYWPTFRAGYAMLDGFRAWNLMEGNVPAVDRTPTLKKWRRLLDIVLLHRIQWAFDVEQEAPEVKADIYSYLVHRVSKAAVEMGVLSHMYEFNPQTDFMSQYSISPVKASPVKAGKAGKKKRFRPLRSRRRR